MLVLRDYLSLTIADAENQWRSILVRDTPAPGKKQVDFLPVETLLCFGLGLVSPPSKSGRINIRESSIDVIAIANLVRRAPGSLALKLANLDGRRVNGARHERELWIALTNPDLARFEFLYSIVLDAARRVGIDDYRLPDFLGTESKTLGAFLEADRVSTEELRAAIEDDLRVVINSKVDVDIEQTERMMLGTARVGQKQFARKVLENCAFECVFCGLGFRGTGLPSARMLVASHIKSWQDSSGSERVDMRNGLAACPTHDAAFDAHLMSVSSALEVVAGPTLAQAIATNSSIERNFGPTGMRSSLHFESSALVPDEIYLKWHRNLVA